MSGQVRNENASAGSSRVYYCAACNNLLIVSKFEKVYKQINEALK